MTVSVAERIERVRREMQSRDCDALVISSVINSRWLTGFSGSNATVVVTEDRFVLITDPRYTTQSRIEMDASDCQADLIISSGGDDSELVKILAGSGRIGLEATNITWQSQLRLAKSLPAVEMVPVEAVIEKLRQIKDQAELELLERAAAIADVAFAATYPLLVAANGITELEFARALEAAMADGGSDEPSFATIVGSGPNGALPHGRPTRRKIDSGDLVVLDFGARVDGYGSDMTRTVLAGSVEPTEEQTHLYDSVAQAQQAGLDAVRAGAEAVSIDSACRIVLSDAGLGDYFTHGTGHGIGLEIHETPILSRRSTGTLSSGLVVTVEPGAYLPQLGGVRVEDSVLVTEDGHRPITHSPKGLRPDFG